MKRVANRLLFGLALVFPLAAGGRALSSDPIAQHEPKLLLAEQNVEIPSGALTLRGVLFRPPGAGPFSAIVYNHGSERDASIEYQRGVADWFQSKGYIVLFPHRRGSGGSQGAYWKDLADSAPDAEYETAVVHALEMENDDVLAAIRWLKKQSAVDPARIAVAGCSFGGIHSLLAAERSPDIYAALDFAGGAMAWSGSPPLRARLERAALGAQSPVFFLQAENDYDTTPSEFLSAIMNEHHKRNQMHIFPRFGHSPQEGHAGFCNLGMKRWGEEVLGFLESEKAHDH